MTNPISFAGVSSSLAANSQNIKKSDIKKLIKYANGETISKSAETISNTATGAAQSSLLLEGLPFIKCLRNFAKGKKVVEEGSEKAAQLAQRHKDLAQLDKNTLNAFKNIFKGEGKLSDRIANLFKTTSKNIEDYGQIKKEVSEIVKSAKTEKKAAKVAEKAAKKVAKKAAKEAAQGTVKDAVQGTVKEAAKETVEEATKHTVEAEAVKSTTGTKLSNLSKIVKKPFTKVANKIKNILPESVISKFGKCGKFMKSSGAGFMLIFSGIAEGLTEVVPTFKELGFKKGIKQLGKSAVKVVGDTAGFIAGQAIGKTVGSIAGAKLGAVIGSVVPGVGTAIGAAAGFVCGLLGSFLAGKLTKSITGPSEREIAKEKQQDAESSEIATNNQYIEQLKQIASQKIAQEYNQYGKLDEDSLEAMKILNKNSSKNIFAA